MNPIPYGKQYITKSDIEAVAGVLKSDFLTQGPKTIAFEFAFSKYIGSQYSHFPSFQICVAMFEFLLSS